MPVLVPYETFMSFRDAARKAKTLAVDNSVETAVRRLHSGWAVGVPQEILMIGIRMMERSIRVDGECGDHYMEEDYHASDAAHGELLEDLATDQEDWARSEEEGWYYGDD